MEQVKNLNALERLDSDMVISFKISGIQVKHLRRFKAVAKECNDSYATALLKLLDSYESDWKYQLLLDKVLALEQVNKEEEPKPRKLGTFGGK